MFDRGSAIKIATDFVIANGYADKPATLDSTDLYLDDTERLLGVKAALAIRYDSLQKIPCAAEEEHGFWYVYFQMKDDPAMARVVCVDKSLGEVVEISSEPQPLMAPKGTDERRQHAEQHVRRATVCRLKGTVDEAIQELLQAVKLNPDYALAYNNLGAIYKLKGQYKDALAALREAVRLKPTDAEFRNNLGVALISIGQREEAISELWESISHNSNSISAYYNLALLYQANSDLSNMLLCLEQLQEILERQVGRRELKIDVESKIRELRQQIPGPTQPNILLSGSLKDPFARDVYPWVVAAVISIFSIIVILWQWESRSPSNANVSAGVKPLFHNLGR